MTWIPSKKPFARPTSRRFQRMATQIQRALAYKMERGDFEPLPALTICRVQVRRDLRFATVFVRPKEHLQQLHKVEHALEVLPPIARKALAETLALRYVPKLSFQIEASHDLVRMVSE